MDEYKNTLKFNTIAQHGGQELDPITYSRAVPIYQTTSYGFESTDHAASLFRMQEDGYIYSRNANPTNRVLEKKSCRLRRRSRCLCSLLWTISHYDSLINTR